MMKNHTTFNLNPNNWGTSIFCNLNEYLKVCHISKMLYSIMTIFMTCTIDIFLKTSYHCFCLNQCFLIIPMYGLKSKAFSFAYAVLIDGTIYKVHVCHGS